MPSIYRYFDLQKFLVDDFNERHSRNTHYSLRAMAERLQLNSGTVVRILKGQRNVSKNLLPVLINYLGLRQKEAEYFKHLVSFCQAKSERARNSSYKELISLRNSQIKTIGNENHSFYEEWYYTAVREVLRIYPFDGDYRKLGNLLSPKITAHKAKRAICLLENLGFIKKSEDGYTVCDNNISTGEKWQGFIIQKFQQETSRKACDALERFTKTDRDFSTMTMSYSDGAFQKVREILKATREELIKLEEADSEKNRVYQINLQVFPFSERMTENTEK